MTTPDPTREIVEELYKRSEMLRSANRNEIGAAHYDRGVKAMCEAAETAVRSLPSPAETQSQPQRPIPPQVHHELEGVGERPRTAEPATPAVGDDAAKAMAWCLRQTGNVAAADLIDTQAAALQVAGELADAAKDVQESKLDSCLNSPTHTLVTRWAINQLESKLAAFLSHMEPNKDKPNEQL